MNRTYVVLVEREVSTDVGDVAFVLLGFYEAHQPQGAERAARIHHELGPEDAVVVVPGKLWRSAA